MIPNDGSRQPEAHQQNHPQPHQNSQPSSDINKSRTPNRSPSTSRFKELMAGWVHRIRLSISPASSELFLGQPKSDQDHRGRSHERKCDRPISTGRGGAGNMVSASLVRRSVDAERQDLKSSGDLIRSKSDCRPKSHGRGGAGNIRSPSRVPQDEAALNTVTEEERQVETDFINKLRPEAVSVGRGGAGNIVHT